ncbi:hypothetical protein LXA43DRAFT_625381 [Ganoderma leucocontextum]|nr:hypothetical protein LXA43DRAFT_625381 [Ganoderma leucocontextum]
MDRASSPISEPSQQSIDMLCHSQEREASAVAMAADDVAMSKKQDKQEADDGEWEPCPSQESVDVDEDLDLTNESEYTASQSTAAGSDSEDTIVEQDREGDDDGMLPPEPTYPSKLTIHHVLIMAKERRALIKRRPCAEIPQRDI